LLRKGASHLGAYSVDAPGFLSAFRGDHTLRSKLLPDVGVISLAVEFGVGQHQSNARFSRGRFDHGGQIRAVVPRPTARDLATTKIAGPDPPPPPTSTSAATATVFARDGASAARKMCSLLLVPVRWRPPQRGPAVGSFFAPAQAAHGFADRTVDGGFIQALQKTIERREVGHTHESEGLTQFAMLAEPHFGFTKGPVFVTHQAENGQQLGLRELVFAETTAVAREHRLGDLQSDAGKGQESDFGHPTSCLHSKQQFPRTWDCEFSWL
jgi:hypothetical protein